MAEVVEKLPLPTDDGGRPPSSRMGAGKSLTPQAVAAAKAKQPPEDETAIPSAEEQPKPQPQKLDSGTVAKAAAGGLASTVLFLEAMSQQDPLPSEFGQAFNTLQDEQVHDHLGSRSGGNYEHLPQPTGPNAKVNVDENMRKAVAHLQSKGWTQEQAVGIVANLSAESALNPRAVGDSGHAYGIGQWHEDRQQAFAQKFGKSIREASLEEQLDFVSYELTEGREQHAGNLLKQTHDAKQAAAVVSMYYERPRDKIGQAEYRASKAGGILAKIVTPTQSQTTRLASLKGADTKISPLGHILGAATAPDGQA